MEILGGSLFAVAGAGESHGPAITTIVFGCPPGQRISRAEIQGYLDRRRPGSNKLGTPRREGDKVVILSGVYSDDHDLLLSGSRIAAAVGEEEVSAPGYEEGFATGEPIAAVVLSAAKRTADYAQFLGPPGTCAPATPTSSSTTSPGASQTRAAGDAPVTGRPSPTSSAAPSPACACATGSGPPSCRRYARSASCAPGGGWPIACSSSPQAETAGFPRQRSRSWRRRWKNPEIRTLDAEFGRAAADLIADTRKQGDSVGAAIEVVAANVPPLAGEPLYDSLKVRLMGSLGGLHAVQACEVGSGIEVVPRRGSENNDPIRRSGYQGNHHGGIIGGVTTGMPLVCRVSFKPTSTIRPPQQSVRKDLSETDFQLQKGRHDPCVGVRAGVTLESRMAIELMDAVLAHQSKRVDAGNFELF